ncbi:hypothetical protein BDF22DRAFT_656212 [Syncephalis plumigaleata]|nr:hypothetical protein BDF22DRAFT_656212 [Syncephalis plumigaleata]
MAAHLALIDAFIHNDDVPAAMSIYEDLRESRMPLTTWHYNALLKAFMSNPDINDQHGARIYEDMRRAHVPFNAYTYTILFNAFGRRGDLNSVQQIHQYLVIDSNIDPDIAVWNSLMDAYQRTDQPVQVVQIWQQLVYDFENNEQARQSSTPVVDCATISIVLDTCGWHYYPWLARRIWQQLPEFGIRPNTNNYVSYIECMTRVGEYDEAMQTFMQVSTIDPTVKWPNYKVVATLAGLLRQKNQSELLDQLTEWVKLHHSSLSAALDPAFIDESNQTTSSSSSSL